MVGFVCYVSGRIDPTQFFYNLPIAFDAAPDLASLKKAVEDRVADDGACVDGAEFIVSDFEILDFRMNTWVNLETRAQMYSGCHITAIRDFVTGSSSGAVDKTSKTTVQKVIGFASRAEKVFDVLDTENEGVIRLRNLINVFRHDVDYAVDVYNTLDPLSTGGVTFPMLLVLFNDSSNRPFFDEMQQRIVRGGKAVGETNSPTHDSPPDSARSSARPLIRRADVPSEGIEAPDLVPVALLSEEQKQAASKVVDLLQRKAGMGPPAATPGITSTTSESSMRISPALVTKLKGMKLQPKGGATAEPKATGPKKKNDPASPR